MFRILKDDWNPVWVYLFLNGTESFLFGLAFTVTMLFQVTIAGLNPLELVLVGSVLEGTILVFEVPTGLVADTISRRLSTLIGLALTGVSFLIQGALPVFGWILVSQVVWGVGYTFTSGAVTAWLVDEIGEDRAGTVFLRETQVSNLTRVGGVLLAVALGSLNLAWPLLLSGGLFILLTGVLAVRMPETGFRPVRRSGRSVWHSMAGSFMTSLRFVRGQSDLRLLFTVTALTGAASEGFDRLMAAHWVRDIGFPAIGGLQPVAWLAAISLLGSLLVAGGARWMEARVDLRRLSGLAFVLSVLVAGTAVGMLLFAVAAGFGLALVGVLVVQVSRGLGAPLTQTWLNRSLPSELRATVLSMAGQMDAVGQVGGGPALGAIGNGLSVRTALGVSAAFLLPAAALYRRWKPSPAPAPIPTLPLDGAG